MTKEDKNPAAELEAATVRSENGGVRGVRVVGPSGQMVLAPPGTVVLAASVGKGVYIEGLKEGWSLASEADEKKRAAENMKKDADAALAEKKAEEQGAAIAVAIEKLQAAKK